MQYFDILQKTIKDFSENRITLDEAEAVSLKMHEMEACGHNFSMTEDRLWLTLTDLIQIHYNHGGQEWKTSLKHSKFS